MTYRELRRKLETLGCRFQRQADGSHEIWINPGNGQRTPIPRHGNRDLATGTLHRCREVTIEVVWVLERAYGFTRVQIAGVLVELITTDSIVVEAADDMARVVYAYRQGGVGFADRMILATAEREGAAPLYTFDRQFARVSGVDLV